MIFWNFFRFSDSLKLAEYFYTKNFFVGVQIFWKFFNWKFQFFVLSCRFCSLFHFFRGFLGSEIALEYHIVVCSLFGDCSGVKIGVSKIFYFSISKQNRPCYFRKQEKNFWRWRWVLSLSTDHTLGDELYFNKKKI